MPKTQATELSVHMQLLLAEVLNLHLLLRQCWAVVLENQGQVRVVSVELLPLEVTGGVKV